MKVKSINEGKLIEKCNLSAIKSTKRPSKQLKMIMESFL